MTARESTVWPWVLGAGAVGGGALLIWTVTRASGSTSRPDTEPSPPPRVPKTQAIPRQTPFSTLDIEAAARMLASENPRGSEQLHIEQVWTQLRSRKRGQSLYDRITAGSGWGRQGNRKPPGRTRPVSTDEPANNAFRALSNSILRGEHPSELPGARKFFEPEQVDRAYAIAQAARSKLAAGQPITDKEKRLLGYKKTAEQVRQDWRKDSSYLRTMDGVEFWT